MQLSKAHRVNYRDLLFLDGLRGLAALFVMMGHARLLLWEGYYEGFAKHPESYNIFNKALVYLFSIFATKYGHFAVLFFFVLSGFVIHLKYAIRLNNDPTHKFDFKNYLFRRIRRIYPPLIFALLLTFLLDSIGRNAGYPIYTVRSVEELAVYPGITSNLDLKTFIANIFFINGTYYPVFGSNGPLWSLKFEWWFYMLYPFFYMVNRKSSVISFLIMIALFVSSFFPELWSFLLLRDVFSMMLCWWIGVFLADIYSGRVKLPFKYLSLLIVFIPVSISGLVSGDMLINDLLCSVGFFGLLALFFRVKENGAELNFLNKLRWLGECSYTLYSSHFPVFILMSGWLAATNDGKLPMTFGYMIAGMGLALSIAYISHFFTEKPFSSKRKIPVVK